MHATLVGLPWNVNMQNQNAVGREAWTIFMEIARDTVDELAVANTIIAVPGGNAALNQPVMCIINN